jgi:hypothetical protein
MTAGVYEQWCWYFSEASSQVERIHLQAGDKLINIIHYSSLTLSRDKLERLSVFSSLLQTNTLQTFLSLV